MIYEVKYSKDFKKGLKKLKNDTQSFGIGKIYHHKTCK